MGGLPSQALLGPWDALAEPWGDAREPAGNFEEGLHDLKPCIGKITAQGGDLVGGGKKEAGWVTLTPGQGTG